MTADDILISEDLPKQLSAIKLKQNFMLSLNKVKKKWLTNSAKISLRRRI